MRDPIDPRFMRAGRPVRTLYGADTATFHSAVPKERLVLFTNGPFDKDTEWCDEDAFPAITGWRRQHALASMRAMVGTLAFVASYERGYRDGLQNALSDGCGALNYLRACPDEP